MCHITQTIEETTEQPSIFYDRYDSHFLTWMSEQGLNHDAPDEEISEAMINYFDTHNTASISDRY